MGRFGSPDIRHTTRENLSPDRPQNHDFRREKNLFGISARFFAQIEIVLLGNRCVRTFEPPAAQPGEQPMTHLSPHLIPHPINFCSRPSHAMFLATVLAATAYRAV